MNKLTQERPSYINYVDGINDYSINIPKLIETVQKCPALYDTTDPGYRDRSYKNKLWERVSEEMCTPAAWDKMSKKEKIETKFRLHKRWSSCRIAFRRELKAQQRDSTAGKKMKRRRYIYYKSLSFLLPFTEQNDGGSTAGCHQYTEGSENTAGTDDDTPLDGELEDSSDGNIASPQNTFEEEENAATIENIQNENMFSSNATNNNLYVGEQSSTKSNKKSIQEAEGTSNKRVHKVLKDVNIPKLIEAVQKRPALYDTKNPQYHDRSYKKKLWEEVSIEMCTPAAWDMMSKKEKIETRFRLNKRWSSCRIAFRRELKAQRRDSSAGTKKMRRRYIYYDSLSFLLPFTEKNYRPTAGRYQNTEESENTEDPLDGESADDSSDCNTASSQNTFEEDVAAPIEDIKKENIFPSKNNASNNNLYVGQQSSSTNSNKRSIQEAEGTNNDKELQVLKVEKWNEDEDLQVENWNEDGDVLFLQSLLPTIKEFTPAQRLELRIEMMRTILKFKARQG